MNSEIKKLHLKECMFRGQKGKIYIQDDFLYVMQNQRNGMALQGDDWKKHGFKYSFIFSWINTMKDFKTSELTLINNKNNNYELWD